MAVAEGSDLSVGMPVQSAEGRPLGAVEAVEADMLRVAGVAYPRAVARIDRGVVVLGPPDEAAPGADARQVIPLAEERLRVETRPILLGEVELRRRVLAEERLVPVVAWREELVVQRRAPGQSWSPEMEPGPDDEVTSIPLRGWEPVVAAEAHVTREVVIERAQVAEAGHVTAAVRREQIAVDEQRRTPPAPGEPPAPPLARYQGSDAAEWAALRQQIRAIPPAPEEPAPVERMVLPLAEEHVDVGGHETDQGEVRLIRRVIREPREVPITVRREVVEVVRRGPDGREQGPITEGVRGDVAPAP